MKRLIWILGFIFIGNSFAQECSHLWKYNLNTHPLTSKGNLGDTSAAYGWIAYKGEPGLRFVLKGKFVNTRFTSIETYEGKFNSKFDALLDMQIVPAAGSQNPFLEGVDIQTPNREYVVDIVPEGTQFEGANVMKRPNNKGTQSFFIRAYSPNQAATLTTEILPKVWAYDLKTGQERECPEPVDMDEYVHYPQIIPNIMFTKQKTFKFKEANGFDIGANGAIPKYLWSANQMDIGDVSVVKFKGPRYMDTTSGQGPFPKQTDTRYWSMCFVNYAKIETLSCLPDHWSKPDPNGFVTAVFGGDERVKAFAEANGVPFFKDTREKRQKVIGYVYRNIVPSEAFKTTDMHKGDYLPRGVVCDPEDFLAKKCGWQF